MGNCDISVTNETLTQYIKDEIDVKILNITNLDTRHDSYTSFKVTIDINDRSKLLSPEVWPFGIICRKYYNPKITIKHG